ncbi:MAG: alpha/beta hydrolase [Eubacteriales bacterium]|nr:alpha/beta hydrolase [Eubacteriales bacterium]
MGKITAKTKFADIQKLPGIEPFKDFILRGDFWIGDILPHLTPDYFTGRGEDIVYGLNKLNEQGEKGVKPIFLYESPYDDKRKATVNIIPFSVEGGEKRPYALVIPGGGFYSTYSTTEGFPIAAKLNEMGYSAFILSHQIGGVGLMPRPLEDVSEALKYIDSHAAELHASPHDYFALGFSAGAVVDALWGTKEAGYEKYGQARPRALFTVYGPINKRKNPSTNQRAAEENMIRCYGIFPDGMEIEGITTKPLYADDLVDADYPPSYIAGCMDDELVSPNHWYGLKEALDKAGVPAVLDIGEQGKHGFGLGTGTSMEGWLERAVIFMNEQQPE